MITKSRLIGLNALLGMVMLGWLSTGIAQEKESWAVRDQINVRLGLGVGELETPISHHSDTTIYALPQLSWYGEKFYFENGLLGYALTERTGSQWDVVFYPNDDGMLYKLNSVFAPTVVATPFPSYPRAVTIVNPPERHLSGMFGFRYSQLSDEIDWSTQFGIDATGVHHGWEWNFKINKTALWEQGNFRLDGDVGLTIKSAKLVDYYYTPQFGEISPIEGGEYQVCDANENCQFYIAGPYEAKTSYRTHAALALHYALSAQWEIIALYRHFWLSSEMTDSPVVTRNQYSASFSGLMYRF